MNAQLRILPLLVCTFAALAACGTTPSPDAVDGEPTTTASASAEAPVDAPPAVREMSAEDCTAKGGELVGDIGDGAIHRPEYRCKSGSPPIGRVPLGIEGSVCCT